MESAHKAAYKSAISRAAATVRGGPSAELLRGFY